MSNPTNITSEGASKKLVPELRFPEFQNKCEWSEYVFGELFIYLPNNTLSRAELTDKRGDVQNIHYGDILIKFPNVLDAQKELLPSISDVEQIRNIETSRLRDGDVVIADTAEDETVGKCTELVNVGDSLIVSGLHTIPCRPNITFTKGYLGHYMNSNAFHHRLRPLMQGAKVTSISKTGLKNVTLTFPHSIAEQQKIAQCLSSLDELIAATKEKVELLKEQKRGLKQKLFPAKGKTLPELRFPEFKNEGEWEEVYLGDVFTERNESNCTSLPLLSIGQDGVYPQSESNKRDISNKDKSKYKRICPNDIGYNTMRMWQGRSALSQIEGIVSPAYTIITPKKGLDPFFLSILLKLPYMVRDFHSHSQGLVNDTLNCKFNDFAKVKAKIPTLMEQQKIATILSSLDDEIEQYSEKVKALELHKKGLMQKLFPKKL